MKPKPRIRSTYTPEGYVCSQDVELQTIEYNLWIKWLWKELKKL